MNYILIRVIVKDDYGCILSYFLRKFYKTEFFYIKRDGV